MAREIKTATGVHDRRVREPGCSFADLELEASDNRDRIACLPRRIKETKTVPETRDAWERITEPMREPVRSYSDLVRKLAGDAAKSLTLFGPIAAGPFDRDRHSVRSVLIVDRVDLAMLRRLAEHGASLGKACITAPLIMTPEYIKASLDTFPLELVEIAQRHLTLFGAEHFDDLHFDDSHVRLQCERELKRILMGLRQGLLAAAGREKLVGALERDVAEGLIRTLRGMMWLEGEKEFKPIPAVVEHAEKLAKRTLPGLRQALDPSARVGFGEFDTFYRDVEALGEIADAL